MLHGPDNAATNSMEGGKKAGKRGTTVGGRNLDGGKEDNNGEGKRAYRIGYAPLGLIPATHTLSPSLSPSFKRRMRQQSCAAGDKREDREESSSHQISAAAISTPMDCSASSSCERKMKIGKATQRVATEKDSGHQTSKDMDVR